MKNKTHSGGKKERLADSLLVNRKIFLKARRRQFRC